MKIRNLAALILVLSAILSPIAQAATIHVFQDWDDRGVLINKRTAQTFASFSDDGISTVGQDSVLVDRFTMNLITDGIGQNFSVADFSDPPMRVEGNMLAIFNNGVFDYLLNVVQGGAARITMRDFNSGIAFYSINIGRGKIDFHLNPSGERDYFLQSTRVSILSPPAVPLPAAVWLFGTALIGLLGFGRRTRTI